MLLLWILFVICVSYLSIISCLFLATLWSPAGKGLTSWLSCIWCFSCVLSLSYMAWYLIVSIPDLCLLYFLLRWLHLWLVRVRANLYVYVGGLPRKCVVYHGSVIPMPSPPSQSHKERLLGIIWIIKKKNQLHQLFQNLVQVIQTHQVTDHTSSASDTQVNSYFCEIIFAPVLAYADESFAR